MAQATTGLKGKSVDDKITYGGTLITSLTGNPNITLELAKLTELTNAKTQLETDRHTAKTAELAARAAFQAQNASEKTFNSVVSDITKIVNATLKDAAKIITTGLPLADESSPVGILPAPGDFSVTYGDEAGEFDAHWDVVDDAASYVVQINITDPLNEGAWSDVAFPTQSKCTIQNLTSGTRCWLRVFAVGTAGRSAPSEDVSKIVP